MGEGDREGTKTQMKLPATNPRDDPERLWAMQADLLVIAESVLGPRDSSKEICAPRFVDDGPYIRNSPNMGAAWVELSRNGENYWPTVVYEMAHETVHLLNPIAGNANNLEEGVAVAFSLYVQPVYGICNPPRMKSYLCALGLVVALPGGPLEAGRRVREQIGALSAATVEDLRELFPSADVAVLSKLVEEFDRDIE